MFCINEEVTTGQLKILINYQSNSNRIKTAMNSINANIFTGIPAELPKELFECIVKRENVHIERIVSKGHMTPTDQWYDQDWDEWVILLQGQATILYEKKMQSITLTPGDYLLIPAHMRHRVEWTTPDHHTIWLTVHLH